MRGRDERLQRHWRLRRKGGVVLGRIAPVRQVPGTHQHGRPLAVAERHQHHRSLRHSRHRVVVIALHVRAVEAVRACMHKLRVAALMLVVRSCKLGETAWHSQGTVLAAKRPFAQMLGLVRAINCWNRAIRWRL